MKNKYLVFTALAFFVLGLFSIRFVEPVYQTFRGHINIKCATKNICVGKDINTIYGLFEIDDIGGLTSIFCGEKGDEGNIEYLELDDILDGTSCERVYYSLHFSTDVNRTKIKVKGTKIMEITQGPLHTLDP